ELPGGVRGRVGDAADRAAAGVVGAGLVGHQGADLGEVAVDPDRVDPGPAVQGGVVGEGHLAHAAPGQGGGGAGGEVTQARRAPGVLAGGEGGGAAADQDDLLRVGFVGGAGGEAVVGAERGQRGDRRGDLGGGGGRQGVAGAAAVQALAGGHVDDGGRGPAQDRVLEERAEDGGERLSGGCRAAGGGGAAEPGEHRGGTGPRVGPAGRGAGVAARSSVICATRGLQGHGAVPLRRTLAGGVPGARGGHHPGGQRQTGGGGGGGALTGPRPCDPRDLPR